MKDTEKKLLLAGIAGAGLLWLMNQKPGAGTPGGATVDTSGNYAGKPWPPGTPPPFGWALGHNDAGVLVLVPYHS